MNNIKIHWHDETMTPSLMYFDESLKCENDGHIGSYFDKRNMGKIGVCTDCLKQGEEEQASIKSIEWFQNGILGGFTFADGHKSLIYQCGECGALLEYNTTYNKHKKQVHGVKDSVQFGWADGEPKWKELDIEESQIEKGVIQE